MSFRRLFTLSVLLIFQYSISQDVVYLDHNLNQITEIEYENLRHHRICYRFTHKTDSVTYKKIGLRHKFGKLPPKKLEQLKLYISSRSKTKLNEDELILIAHIDSLHDYSSYVRNFIRTHPDNFNPSLKVKRIYSEKRKSEFPNARLYMLEKDEFIKSENKRFKRNVKCKNQIQKQYPVQVFYSYSEKFRSEPFPDELNWIPDNGIFKSQFFPFEHYGKVIIIKPNGEYFVSSSLNSKLEKVLIKKQNWKEAEAQLIEIVKNNPLYRNYGIFTYNRDYKCFK